MHSSGSVEELLHPGLARQLKRRVPEARARDINARTSTVPALPIANNELLHRSAQHLTTQENERRRIAADLHDGLGQSLGLVILSLENIGILLSQGEPEKAAESLKRLNPRVRDTLDELRRIAMNLRPATLDSLGILATLSWHLREIEEACPDIRIERRFSVDETEVPKNLRTPIFRILQEAGRNAITHGEADRITVCLSKTCGALELSIEDNGKGFDPGALSGTQKHNRGLGLQSMRERAELTCGILEIRSAPGKGMQVRVRWPASGSDIGPGHAIAPEPAVQSIQDPGFSNSDHSQDWELLDNLSACAACIRRINNHG